MRELVVLWPVAILTLVLGVAPSIWLPAIESGIERIQQPHLVVHQPETQGMLPAEVR